MAELSRADEPLRDDEAAGDAGEPRAGGDGARAGRLPPMPPDARSIVVRLAAASRLGHEAAIVVAPAPDPLLMTNPTVGVGPLGGVVVIPPAGEETVRTQRHLLVDGEPADASLEPLGGGRYRLARAGGVRRVVLEDERAGSGGVRVREVLVDGFRLEVEVESERIVALRERASRGRAASVHGGPLEIRAIIPGKVASVSVAAGDAVTAGQQLLAVEAMKMQNELRAPRDGTIERVGVAPGVNIEVGDLLVVIS